MALIVLGQQAVDGVVRIRTKRNEGSRPAFSPEMPLREAVQAIARLAGDATALVVDTHNSTSELPGCVELEIHERTDASLTVRDTCVERQTARLIHAWCHAYAPAALVSDVPLLCPADAEELRSWEHNLDPVPATTLDALFTRTAREKPDKVAVAVGQDRLTYGQAEDLSGRLASSLLRGGLRTGEPVVVLSVHPLHTAIDQLAVLKAGGTCVPVGHVPPERARAIAALTRTRHAVVRGPARSVWQRHCQVLVPDDPGTERSPGGTPIPHPQPRSVFTDEAYLLVAPGTGHQPGAQYSTHAAWVSAIVSRIRRVGRTSGEVRVYGQPWEGVFLSAMWWAFTCGGTLRRALPTEATGPDATRHPGDAGTDSLLTPPQYRQLLDSAEATAVSGPGTVVLTGDRCPQDLVRRHFGRGPGTRLLTEYSGDGGPLPWTATELHPADAEQALAPSIGRPSPNVHVHIVDRSGRRLPAGLPGELCAEGIALPHAAAPYTRAAQQSTDQFLRSSRIAVRRMDGSLELVSPSSGDTAAGPASAPLGDTRPTSAALAPVTVRPSRP
ncbi:AMP-binding protein [Streptomyces sp. URMC 127]|uniref:AMP-binding protein n=1 Tax=Streptomyces sp. URMC 127 TaxID=3423402 RepID=UPI003F1B8507